MSGSLLRLRLLESGGVTLFESLFKKPADRLIAKDFGAVQPGPAARNTSEPSCSTQRLRATLRRAALVLRPSPRVHKQRVLPPLCRAPRDECNTAKLHTTNAANPSNTINRTGLNFLAITSS
jgi:hypothetical protein